MKADHRIKHVLEIDGSFGEGGGQILRTSLSLSMITGRPIHLKNIRAKRPKPGLLRQHLTAIQASAAISKAKVDGVEIGSQTVFFEPGEVDGGDYSFRIGSAGSVNLVLQTLMPALIFAAKPSIVSVEGGTHNPQSPPFDFLTYCFGPILSRMGVKHELTLNSVGFYPAGGGLVSWKVQPVRSLQPIHVSHRGMCVSAKARVYFSKLPFTIAEREHAFLKSNLTTQCDIEFLPHQVESPGPGNSLHLGFDFEHVSELFSGFGKPGLSAEMVAKKVCDEAEAYLKSEAAFGEYLADQMLLYIALAGNGSFTTHTLSSHFESNKNVIEMFLPIKFEVRCIENGVWNIKI